jgi:drug/metabolite transporter (DMT)-like permease
MAGSIPIFTALGGRIFKGHTVTRQRLLGLGVIRLSRLTPWEAAAFVNGCSSILLVPLLLMVGVPRLLTAPWDDVAFQASGQGVVAGVLGLVAYTVAISRLGPARSSLSTAMVPLMTALGGTWILDERLTAPTLWALLLVVPGIAVAGGALQRLPKSA